MKELDGTVETNPLPKAWPKQLTGSPLSLRIFERTDEIYRHGEIRAGDYAEITRSHCTSSESGLLVKVIDEVHWCVLTCADCGQHMREYQVRIEPLDAAVRVKWELQAPGGPWLYPIAWLKRWSPRV